MQLYVVPTTLWIWDTTFFSFPCSLSLPSNLHPKLFQPTPSKNTPKQRKQNQDANPNANLKQAQNATIQCKTNLKTMHETYTKMLYQIPPCLALACPQARHRQ